MTGKRGRGGNDLELENGIETVNRRVQKVYVQAFNEEIIEIEEFLFDSLQ